MRAVTNEIQRHRKHSSIYAQFVAAAKDPRVKFTDANKTGAYMRRAGAFKGLAGPFNRLYMDAVISRDPDESDAYFPVVADPASVIAETAEELVTAGFPGPVAYGMCAAAVAQFGTAAAYIKALPAVDSRVEIRRDRDVYVIWCRHTVTRITVEHFEKLRALYRPGADTDEQAFLDHVFRVLVRYGMLSGATVADQGAVPKHVFAVLHDQEILGTSAELFASPLNCSFGEYCSLFPDTDAAFGSRGSFFETWTSLKPGSYEANPPFILGVMERMAEILLQILDSGESFTFFVIVPVWTDVRYIDALAGSRHLVLTRVLEPRKHDYIAGDQHLVGMRPQGTAVKSQYFVLTSDKTRFGPQRVRRIASALAAAFAKRMPLGPAGRA